MFASANQRRISGILAAAAGAVIGFFGVGFIARYGIHAIVLPAALPGSFAGIFSKERSAVWAVSYALLGAAAALYTEWHFRPFIADPSFRYFVGHIRKLLPVVQAVIAAGAFIGGVLSISFGRTPRTDTKDA